MQIANVTILPGEISQRNLVRTSLVCPIPIEVFRPTPEKKAK